MYGYRMSQCVNVACVESSLARIGTKETLYLSLLQCALPSGEQVRRDIPTHSQIRAQKFRRVSPQGFLSADTVFKSPYADTVIF